MTEVAVVTTYFNPVGYRCHQAKLARCLAAAAAAGIDVLISGAGPGRPPGGNVVFWDDDGSVLWHKERLINLAVRRLPARYTQVAWIDNDIVIGPGWAAAVGAALTEAPLVQCFRTARYETVGGRHCRSRPSYLCPGRDGAIGLAWAAGRDFFTSGPGLFDLAVVGGGDAILGAAAVHEAPAPSTPWTGPLRSMFRPWPAGMLTAMDEWTARLHRWSGGVRPAVARTAVTVVEHGPAGSRDYYDRQALLSSFAPQRHLVTEPERVHRWSPAGRRLLEPAVRAYFRSRSEDDPSPA